METIFGYLFVFAVIYVIGFVLDGDLKSIRRTINAHTTPQMLEARQNALKEAGIYLSPYKDIWKNLRLSNRICSLLLGEDGETIRGIEKVPPFRKFIITSSNVHSFSDLWNYFCVRFSYNTSYDGLKEQCIILKASYTESLSNTGIVENYKDLKAGLEKEGFVFKPPTDIEINKALAKEKVDINNCSEVELTELPGVSIVLAKKAIKKRDEIGGFKSAEDFFLFLKLKPHLQKQLNDLIIVEKMKNKPRRFLNKERKIDL